MALGIAEAVRENIRSYYSHHAEQPGRDHAHPDKREHVEVHRSERIPAAYQERPAAPKDHRRPQYQFDPKGGAFSKEFANAGEP